MAIQLGAGMQLRSQTALDDRNTFETISDMKSFPDSSIDDGHISYCVENRKTYQYKVGNSLDPTTGRWREFSGSGGGSLEISQEAGNSIVEKPDGIYSPNLVETVNGMAKVDKLQDLPVGSIVNMDWEQAPSHWIELGDSRTVYNIADYPDLAETIRQQKGSVNFYGGNGTTTFAIPSKADVTNSYDNIIARLAALEAKVGS